jgi:hypothetical protein
MSALSSLSPRAARAHALKNCLAAVRAVNRLLESDLSERWRERLSRSQEGSGTVVSIRMPAPLPAAFALERLQAR